MQALKGKASVPVALPEPLISVVIAAYNYAAVLPRALDSVLSQWAEDIEVLIINDGSEDNTAQVLEEYAQDHPDTLQIIHQQNAGPAAARNRGIRAARGKYVLLLDADDELLPEALQTLRAVLLDNSAAGMILGAHISVFADGRERVRLPTPATGSPPELIRRYLLDKKISISHSRTLFRRDLLLQRPYPEALRAGEDVAVFAYLLVSAPVALTHRPLARIHKHANSLRHDRHDEKAVAQGMLREVFTSLPEACQIHRAAYEAQRYLSLFRAAMLAGDKPAARRFYRHALGLSPLQALRWSYLKKALRLGAGLG